MQKNPDCTTDECVEIRKCAHSGEEDRAYIRVSKIKREEKGMMTVKRTKCISFPE